MQRLSIGRLAWGLIFGISLAAGPLPANAQDNTERVKFDTWDMVELRGTFYPSSKVNKAPAVILLHSMGGSSSQEGWPELAAKLQKEGYAVLSFDFRGHGESVNVGQQFWVPATNQSLKSFRPGKLKEQISYNDFTSRNHYCALIDDIVAAKHFLDRKNDTGECNSSNVILIGAESGATIGAMWLWHAYNRAKSRTVFQGAVGGPNQFEGQDVSCAIFLSVGSTIGSTKQKFNVNVDSWLQKPVKDKIPMFFTYGEQDTKAKAYAHRLYSNVLHADKDSKLKLTIEKGIPGTKLSGRELLGKASLGTEETILTYIARVLKDNPGHASVKKDADRSALLRVPFANYLQ